MLQIVLGLLEWLVSLVQDQRVMKVRIMKLCTICQEEVDGPCETVEEAREGGCINPPKVKRLLDPKVAERVVAQTTGLHSKTTTGSGSWN